MKVFVVKGMTYSGDSEVMKIFKNRKKAEYYTVNSNDVLEYWQVFIHEYEVE